MYRVILNDNNFIYDSNVEDLIITTGKIELELNKAGSFEFTLYPSNPCYEFITKLTSYIKVYRDTRLIFSGRVLDTKGDFYNGKTVYCEGELAYLNDTIQYPKEFNGTIQEVLEDLIEKHNEQMESETEKQFALGDVNAIGANENVAFILDGYKNTLASIMEKIVNIYGGYIIVRHDSLDSSIKYIDYLKYDEYTENFAVRSDQTVEFGENLLDYADEHDASSIVTALIPLGAEIEDENGFKSKVTIENVNDGKDYIYNQVAVDLYGWIFAIEEWKDVVDPAALLINANQYLADIINMSITINLKAIDLSNMDKDIDDFYFGEYVKIISEPHNLDGFMLIKKQSLDILNLIDNTISLGSTKQTLIDQQVKTQSETLAFVNQTKSIIENYLLNKIMEAENNLTSSIEQTAERILSKVSETYTTGDNVDSRISTQISQTSESIEMRFDEYEAFREGTTTNFSNIQKYIRFEDGNIILGDEESSLGLKIASDKIVFTSGALELAYFQNDKLYVTHIELPLKGDFKMGNFSFIPRSSGNLSLKYTGG